MTDDVAGVPLDPICLDTLSLETRHELERRIQYHAHVLRLYGGTPLAMMHGQRDGSFVHIRPVDDTMTAGTALWLAAQCRNAGGAALDILAWEYAPGLDAVAVAQEALARESVALMLRLIPREVMERGIGPSDAPFWPLPVLRLESRMDGATVTVALRGYDLPGDQYPPPVRAITCWSDALDGWMVDWQWGGEALNVGWSAQRARGRRGQHPQPLALSASHTYERPGRYRVLVQACDLLGIQVRAMAHVEVQP